MLEQECLYPDIDGLDADCEHLYCVTQVAGSQDGTQPEVVACARIMAPGLVQQQASFGRVAVAASQRSTGLGRELTKRILQRCAALYPESDVRISAQVYLQKFYSGFGFVLDGEPFSEDGIDHVHMLLSRAGTMTGKSPA